MKTDLHIIKNTESRVYFYYEELINLLREHNISLRSLDRDPKFPISEKTIRRSKYTGLSKKTCDKLVDYLIDYKDFTYEELDNVLQIEKWFSETED